MILLITGAWRYTNEQLTKIKQLGHEVILLQNENDALPCKYDLVEGVICNGLFLYHPIERFVNLKYIQLTSAGFDRVPMEYVESHNIAVKNARGVYSIPMAEFALSSVLSIYKHTDFFRKSQALRRWNKHRGLREIYGKRVCIVGCGSVGSECALRFFAMGCDVVGIDSSPIQKDCYRSVLPINELKNTVATSDIIVLTLPLTNETRGIVNSSVLSALPIGAVIVNISRGDIIDNKALFDMLLERPDITAVLDVFSEEPIAESNLIWNMPNVVITPHNSFVGEGNSDRLWSLIINNLCEFNEQ